MGSASSVLIADDDEDIRLLVSTVLRNAGFEAKTVDGGLPALTAPLPAIYVLDVRMPDMSGLEVCRRLRANGGDRPVLLISAESSAADVAAAYAAGCDDYLPKPFRASELVRRVDQLLARADVISAAVG